MRACRYETPLVASLRSGAWPLGADPELRQHAKHCRRCGETVAVASALLAAAAAGLPTAPPPGTLWWRAQILRRQHEVAEAARVLAWSDALGLAAALAGLVAIAVWQREPALSWLRQLGTGGGAAAAWPWMLLAGSLAALAGCSVAAWFAVRKFV